MFRRVIAIVLLLACTAGAANVALRVSPVNAQEPPTAEVRLGARAFGGGSFSIGLQHRVDGDWRTVTPTRHILPRSANTNQWYTTSAVAVDVPQANVEVGLRNRTWTDEAGPEQFTVTLGDTRYSARCGRLILALNDDGLEMQTGSRNCEEIVTVRPTELTVPTDVGAQVLRVAARQLSNVGIELGLQRLVDGRWEALRQPARPVLSGLPRNVWRYTSVLGLPALSADIVGELRRGASIMTRDGDFDIEVDGRVYRTQCGVLDLRILAEQILVDTATEGCLGGAPLLTICPTSHCDVQQNAVYAWESRQIGTSLNVIAVTRSEAQAVVNAIYADFYPLSRAPTVSFSGEQSHGHADRYEIVLGTNVRYLGAVVHELAHALIDGSFVRDPGHGRAFTSMLLYLWERYFQVVDVEAARDDADRLGIEVGSQAPLRAKYREADHVIGQLFCEQPHHRNSLDLCDAASGAMSERLDVAVSGSYTGWGGNDDFRWAAHADDEGGALRSYVATDAVIGQTGSIARLTVRCEDDQLEMNVYWDVERDLDWTILYRIDNGAVQNEEWISGWGTWGDTEYKWTGREDAGDLISQMAWAAQTGGSFTVQSHAQDNPSEVYTATFDLDGLFETPVQPNLARCGR